MLALRCVHGFAVADWSPLELFCLLAGLVVWAVAGIACIRLVLAHRRAWPPDAEMRTVQSSGVLPLHARLAALDALLDDGRIDPAEYAARRSDLLTGPA